MEKLATYTLRSKDTPLLRFSLLGEKQEAFGVEKMAYSVHILQCTEDKGMLPYSLRSHLSDQCLLRWIERRKAPKNRQFVNEIMRSIEDSNNPLRYVDISHALSLNDTLWITNDAVPARWNDFSLYRHPFNDVLAYVAFTGYSERVPGVVSSPELTSSGALKKCWSNRGDGIYLIKGDDLLKRDDGRSQATMEFYAAQIAERMGLAHINYDLEEFHHRDGEREIVCTCKLFTSEHVGYVNALDFFCDHGIDMDNVNMEDLSTQVKMAHMFGLPDYEDIMVFDAIICNQDRHLGNFGYLIDNDTGKYLRPAPIFDNGFSLLVGASQRNMKNLSEYISSIHGKYLGFDEQAQLFLEPRHVAPIRSLVDFSFTRHPKYNVSDDCLSAMSKMIRLRAQRLLEIFQTKKKYFANHHDSRFLKKEEMVLQKRK